MFCPNCSSEDRQNSQYCRACGADLRAVRQGLAKPDVVTASAASARDEIGRAIAAQIRELETSDDLKQMVEDVLPKIEKFLESPQERRLRRVRAGVYLTGIGLGVFLFFLLLSMKEEDIFFLTSIGAAAFLVGLGIIINGLMFTVPKEQTNVRALDAVKEESERSIGSSNTREELPAASQMSIPIASVTDHTTHRLPNEAALMPKVNSQVNRSE